MILFEGIWKKLLNKRRNSLKSQFWKEVKFVYKEDVGKLDFKTGIDTLELKSHLYFLSISGNRKYHQKVTCPR